MTMMITYRGYNNSTYNSHKNMGAYYTWQNMVPEVLLICLIMFLKLGLVEKKMNLKRKI